MIKVLKKQVWKFLLLPTFLIRKYTQTENTELQFHWSLQAFAVGTAEMIVFFFYYTGWNNKPDSNTLKKWVTYSFRVTELGSGGC
jgi:hypothetical protein